MQMLRAPAARVALNKGCYLRTPLYVIDVYVMSVTARIHWNHWISPDEVIPSGHQGTVDLGVFQLAEQLLKLGAKDAGNRFRILFSDEGNIMQYMVI
jgi:hypothetical protein